MAIPYHPWFVTLWSPVRIGKRSEKLKSIPLDHDGKPTNSIAGNRTRVFSVFNWLGGIPCAFLLWSAPCGNHMSSLPRAANRNFGLV